MPDNVMDISAVVMTLTVFFTEAFKRYLSKKGTSEEDAKFWAPFSAIIIGVILNMGFVLLLQVNNYYEFWHNFIWQQTLKDGLDIGMKAGGLYGMGKVVVNRVSRKSTNKKDNSTAP